MTGLHEIPVDPPPAEPDAKDWTWVIDTPCPECGFDPAALSRAGIADWARPGRRSNGSVSTIESLGRDFVHDLVHHLHDVGARPRA